jgi:hypothetical protein
MLGHYIFLKYACLVVLILGAPSTLWLIGIGNLKLGIPMLLVCIVAFIAYVSAAKQVKRIREMGCRRIDDDIKPV